MKTDIEIAQSVALQPIVDVVKKVEVLTTMTWNCTESTRPSSVFDKIH